MYVLKKFTKYFEGVKEYSRAVSSQSKTIEILKK